MGFSGKGPLRLAIVATHPIQYQCPVWRELAHRPDLDVRVYFGSDFSVRGYRDREFGVEVKWDVPLTTGYSHAFLDRSAASDHNETFFAISGTGLSRYLAEFEPEVGLVCGYMRSFWLQSVMAFRRRRVPVVMRSEATDEAFARGVLKGWARECGLRLFYRQFAHFLALGAASREHYARMGIRADRVSWCPYNVDTDNLSSQRVRYAGQRDALRREFAFEECRTVFLYSGKLIGRKDPMAIATALALLPTSSRESIGLLIVGDGELRNTFETALRPLLGKRAVFVGFVNQLDIGRYYSAADCLVMPSSSRETWGLVVNEALQFGIPAIVSDRVGCARDVIRPGETGEVYPAGDNAALARHMAAVHDKSDSRRELMRRACEELIANYSTQIAADCVERAVKQVGRV